MDVHFSSKTDMWATPQNTFDALAAEFGGAANPAPFPSEVVVFASSALKDRRP